MRAFSFGELKLGLLCCTVYKNCAECPCYRGPDLGPEDDCSLHLMTAAMNCINVMEKDLAVMTKRAEEWEEQCTMRENELYELRASLDGRTENEDNT